MQLSARRLRLLAAFAWLLAHAVPPHAQAAPTVAVARGGGPTLVVDKFGDSISGGDTCDSGPSNCPLRKAIQLSANADDTIIMFDPAIFTAAANPIQLNSPLNTITRQGTRINGSGATVKVTFNGTTSDKETIFRIDAHDVVLESLTIYGATRANIQLFQRADRRITVRNNVIGVASAGTTCPIPNQTSNGIFVSIISPSPNDNSAVYLYGNQVECHNSATSGTGGIIVDAGRRVFIGLNESNQTFPNILRANRNGIGLLNGVQSSIIRGNTAITSSRNGIFIENAAAVSPNENKIEDNLIGTTGTSLSDGNRGHGININNSSDTLIKNNVIAGNKNNGISINGTASVNTKIESNFIGVARDRQTIIPNGNTAEPDERLKNGIYIGQDTAANGYASRTTIGGTQASQLNTIGNSAGHGILIDNSDNNLVMFNDIGFTSANNNLPLPNGGAGIKIMNTATNNIIGQEGDQAPLPVAPQANFIWNNTGPGIEINGADGNKIYGNSLRFNATGVRLINADTNEIYRTRIVENTGAGISEEGGSDTNLWSEISTSANGGAGGIDKTAGSPNPGAPHITFAQRLNASTYRVQGASSSGATVEVYLSSLADPNEGTKFIGRVTAVGTAWSIDATIPAGTSSFVFLATQTLGAGTSRRSSEFSRLFVPKIYIPLTRKP